MKKLTAFFVKNPIGAALLMVLSVLLLFDLWIFKWPENLNDVLIEAHGVVFDLLVFGVVLAAYERLRQREKDIQRYQEEISDFRGWNEKEAKYRIVGNIRRLNNKGVSNISLQNCYLVESLLSKADLRQANLILADLNCASLSEADLTGAKLIGADLKLATMTRTNLTLANLTSANLSLASLHEAVLTKACLKEVILDGTKGLTAEMLSTCSTLYKARGIPKDLLFRLEKENPELFEEPKEL